MKYSEANEKLNLKNMLAEIKVQKVLRKPLGGGETQSQKIAKKYT